MRDKLKKREVFIKYILLSLTCFGIDILLFTVLNTLFKNIMGDSSIIVGSIIARIISSFINYLFNGKCVFKMEGKRIEPNIIVKYYLLVVTQMFMSSILVYIFYNIIGIDETIIKLFVDGLIFLVNYFINKKFIFVRRESYEEKN